MDKCQVCFYINSPGLGFCYHVYWPEKPYNLLVLMVFFHLICTFSAPLHSLMHATGSLLALILDVQYSTAACRAASPLGDELNRADY